MHLGKNWLVALALMVLGLAAFAKESPAQLTFHAVVNADGTLARGERATFSQGFGNGAYEVIFNRNVRSCAYSSTIGLSGSSGSSSPGETTVVGRSGNNAGVFVTTHRSDGVQENRGFHLLIDCKKPSPAAAGEEGEEEPDDKIE